jgi:hypothetical protein
MPGKPFPSHQACTVSLESFHCVLYKIIVDIKILMCVLVAGYRSWAGRIVIDVYGHIQISIMKICFECYLIVKIDSKICQEAGLLSSTKIVRVCTQKKADDDESMCSCCSSSCYYRLTTMINNQRYAISWYYSAWINLSECFLHLL